MLASSISEFSVEYNFPGAHLKLLADLVETEFLVDHHKFLVGHLENLVSHFLLLLFSTMF